VRCCRGGDAERGGGPGGPASKVDLDKPPPLPAREISGGAAPPRRRARPPAATRPASCAKGGARQQCRLADPRGAAEKRMKLGYFTMPVHPPARRYVETLKEDREAFILADRLGYSEGYCGEHLTDSAETIPNSVMF